MGNSQSQSGGNSGNGGAETGPVQLDYYDLLGVDEEAGDDEIKVRHRDGAMTRPVTTHVIDLFVCCACFLRRKLSEKLQYVHVSSLIIAT